MKTLISISFLLLTAATLRAQPHAPSNQRQHTISTRITTIRLDTLSIIPGSLRIPNTPDSLWRLDAVDATLHWLGNLPGDSVTITYRVFPYRLNAPKRQMGFDTVMGKFVIAPLRMPTRRPPDEWTDGGRMNYNGSLGRGIAFGNRQDPVLNSTLNLQLNGYLGDSIRVAAAITDNNIPVQPDGNTQNLNEFDQVQLRFSKNGRSLTLGDFDLRRTRSPYLNFYKRLQGALFEAETRHGPSTVNNIVASAAVARGKFTRNVFQGIEGNQGPYRLTGANGEPFFIVLAGTERVWIDGVQLQRGQDQDYIINYNTAEVTFTPKQMITRDKRIQIEFEYADRNYLNAQFYLSDELRLKERTTLRIGAYLNQDARNAPVNMSLDAPRRQFLANIGDSTHKAFFPSAVIDSFAAGKILYARKDTTLPGGRRDSFYVFSQDRSRTLYTLNFIDVGPGRGHYLPDPASAANGKVYRWSPPDPATGQPTGQFEPAILLVAPRSQQVFTAGIDQAVGRYGQLSADLSLSVFDANRLSAKDKGDDPGIAARAGYRHEKPLQGPSARTIGYEARIEHVDAAFRPVERLRDVEFNRDWGLPIQPVTAGEDIFRLAASVREGERHTLAYGIAGLRRTTGEQALRHELTHRLDQGKWQLDNNLRYTRLTTPGQTGNFLRPTIRISRKLPKWQGMEAGIKYDLEHNERRDRQTDILDPLSFSFDIFEGWLRSPEQKPDRWGISYFTRSDKYPVGHRMQRADRSHNIGFNTALMSREHHQFRLATTYRKLQVYDPALAGSASDETILGRFEYNANGWKGAIAGNLLYELGTGQEPRRDFTYLEVPAGQGEYAWIDYNADGLQQLNEFEIAQFRDQARFIRVFTPSSRFIRANYLQFNYSLVFNPRAALGTRQTGLRKILARTWLQSNLQVGRKNIAAGLASFDPFADPLADSTLITLDRVWSNSFSFNRSSQTWGLDLNNIRTDGRSFLSYGYETRSVNDWNARARYNPDRRWSLQMLARAITHGLETPLFSNRNYRVKGRALEPRLIYTHGTNFRAQAGYVHTRRRNEMGAETSLSDALQTECKYNLPSRTALSARFTLNRIEYDSPPQTAVAYLMLDGLQPGRNRLWSIDLTRRLTTFLELSMQYEGRQAGRSGTVHTGRAQLRAIF